MPYNERTPGAAATSAAGFPISRGFAITVLAAVAILIVLRHVYGSISIQAGAS
jgi:hypothetical protein